MDDSRLSKLTSAGSPFEIARTCDSTTYRHAPGTIPELLSRGRLSAALPFLTCGMRVFTFAAVLGLADQIRGVFTRQFGSMRGLRVAIILDNGPEWVASFVAIANSGAVAVLMDHSLPAAELAVQIESCNCAVLITTGPLRERFLEQPLDLTQRFPNGISFEAYSDRPFLHVDGRPSTQRGSDARLAIRPEDDAIIAMTSGSTGPAKGVLSTQAALSTGVFNAMLAGAMVSVRGGNVVGRAKPCSLVLSQFWHISGLLHVLCSMVTGNSNILVNGFDVGTAIDSLERHRPTSITGAHPELIHEILSWRADDSALGGLRGLGVHGYCLNPALIERTAARFPGLALSMSYGATETNGILSIASRDELLRKPQTSGRILPTFDSRLDAAAGLSVRGPSVMKEYVGHGCERTRQDPGGTWFSTGDCVSIDSEGFIYLQHRKEAPLASQAIEQAVKQLDQVVDVVVLPDAALDSGWVVTFVADGHASEVEAAICQRVSSLGYGGNVRLTRLPRLPRTTSGKPDRRILRALAAATNPDTNFRSSV